MKKEIRNLHDALMDLASMMNRPQNDAALIEEAGLSIDRALFPLLVYIERRGPIGVGDLADVVGRDYSTVSRQVAKLESLGLITRRPSKRDQRKNESAITAKGRKMTDALDKTRQHLAEKLLAKWSKKELQELHKLMRRFIDDLTAWKR